MYDLNLKIKNLEFKDDKEAKFFEINLMSLFDSINIDPATVDITFDKFPDNKTQEIKSLKEFKKLFPDYNMNQIKSSQFNWDQISKYQLSDDIIDKYEEHINWDILIEEYNKGNVKYDNSILSKHAKNRKPAYIAENRDIQPIPIIANENITDMYNDYIDLLKKCADYLRGDVIDIDNTNKRLSVIFNNISLIYIAPELEINRCNSINYDDYITIYNYCKWDLSYPYSDGLLCIKVEGLDEKERKDMIEEIKSLYKYNNINYRYNKDDDDLIEVHEFKIDNQGTQVDYHTESLKGKNREYTADEIVDFIKSTDNVTKEKLDKLKNMLSHIDQLNIVKLYAMLDSDIELSQKYVNFFSIEGDNIMTFEYALEKVVDIFSNIKYPISQKEYEELEKIVVSVTNSEDPKFIVLTFFITKSITNRLSIFDYIHNNYDNYIDEFKEVADIILKAKEEYDAKNNKNSKLEDIVNFMSNEEITFENVKKLKNMVKDVNPSDILTFDEALELVISVYSNYNNKPVLLSEEEVDKLKKVIFCGIISSDTNLKFLSMLISNCIRNGKNIIDYINENYSNYDDKLKEVANKVLDSMIEPLNSISDCIDSKDAIDPIPRCTNRVDLDSKSANIKTITSGNIASIFGNPNTIPNDLWKKISSMNLSKEFIINYKNKLNMKVLIANPIFGKYMASDMDFFDMFIDDAKKCQAKKSDGTSLYRINLNDFDI